MTASHRLLEHNAFAAPLQADRYVPWARAVTIVGEHLHKDEWTGSELARAEYTIFDRWAEIDAKVRKKFPMAKAAKASPTFGSAIKKGKPLDPALVAHIKAAAEKRDAESKVYADEIARGLPPLSDMIAVNNARKSRLVEAQNKLFGAIINGSIQAFWYADGSADDPRKVPAGELVKDWNAGSSNLRRRGYIWRERAAWYVYVDAAELAKLYASIPDRHEVAAALGLPHISPYMELMIAVARKYDITPDNQPFSDALKAEIKAMAPAFGLTVGDNEALSTRNVQVMATFLRQPLPKKGAPT